MITLGKSIRTILITASIAFMTGCGGGGGGGNVQPTPPPVQEDVITWTNGIYDPWVRTTQGATSSTNSSCTVDIYSQDVWWEKNINGISTGIKGTLIRTDTEERNEQCPVTETSSSDNTVTTNSSTISKTTDNVVVGTQDVVVTYDDGSEDTMTYYIQRYITATTTITTTTATTTTTKTFSDGTTTETVSAPIVSTTEKVDTSEETKRDEIPFKTVATNVITWTNGIYDPWVLTTQGTTSSTNPSCTVDIYSQNVWWEKNINGVPTGFKGSLIRTDTEERNEQCPVTIITWTSGVYDPWALTTTDAQSSTNASCTVDIYSQKVWWEKNINGVPTGIKGSLIRTDTSERNEQCPVTETSSSDNTVTTSAMSEGSPSTETTSTTEVRVSLNDAGSTLTQTYTIYTDITTIVTTTTATSTTTTTKTFSDGSTTKTVADPIVLITTSDATSSATREELTNTVITPNVASVSDANSTTSTSSDATPVVTTTNVTDSRTSTDADGSTIIKVYKVYTDTSTVTTTTVTTATTTRTTVLTDGTSSSEVINTSTTSATNDTVTTANREELISTSTVVNVVSTSDSDSTTSTSADGSATLVTTSSSEDRTSTDADGSTVVKTYTIYTDTYTTPVTTTTTVTTTRFTTWTDNSVTSEVIKTSSSDSISNTVTTATREELTNTVVTPNVASTSTIYKNERTANTESELISELYGTNSDVVPVGTDADGNTQYQSVTLYYYSWHNVVSSTVLKDKYTRTTYTDGAVVDSLVTADIASPTTTTKEYLLDPWGGKKTTTQRVPIGETFVGNPVAPGDSSGSSGVYTYKQRTANHSTSNYNASTYYNDVALGTPTAGVNNDPATYETTEAENGATLVTYANHAYSRGWTGKGSTALIMDTGIDQDHPEFVDKVKYLWDAGYDTAYEDENGHGTHVAGIVSANKDGVGIHGVAYDTDLAIAKIGEANGISLSAAREALQWAKQYDDIVVANLSANTSYSSSYKSNMTDQGNGVFTNDHAIYGGSNYYNLETAQSWKDVIPDELVLVVAAGNSGNDYVQNPATFASATDSNGDLELDGRMLVAGNWNTSTQTIDGAKSGHVCKDYTTQCNDTYKTSDFYLLAPGTNINSTYNDGGYKNMSGTSMSAPVVTAGVSIVHQMWPYMKGKNIAQVLLQTANKNLSNYSVNTHGQGLMDLDKATQPIGGLGISTTGRTGDVAPLSGHIAVSGVDGAVVSSVSAVDDFDRDFNVDLSSMVNSNNTSIEQLKHKRGQSWAVKQASIGTSEYKNVTVGTDNKGTYALGYTHDINNNLDLNVTYSETKNSPWIDMSGVWGEVNGATTVDTSLTWSDDELWAQVGVMNTKTDINKGLVVNVDDAISAYFVGGVDLDDFTFYAGVKPKVIRGNIDLSIPDSVDSNGIMHYNSTTSNYGASTVPFVGASHMFYFKENDTDVSLSTDAIADADGNHSLGVMFEYKF